MPILWHILSKVFEICFSVPLSGMLFVWAQNIKNVTDCHKLNPTLKQNSPLMWHLKSWHVSQSLQCNWNYYTMSVSNDNISWLVSQDESSHSLAITNVSFPFVAFSSLVQHFHAVCSMSQHLLPFPSQVGFSLDDWTDYSPTLPLLLMLMPVSAKNGLVFWEMTPAKLLLHSRLAVN